MSEGRVLLVDDEPNITAGLTRTLGLEPWDIFTANSARDGLKVLAENEIDVVISDEQMPEMSGSMFLTEVRKLYPQTIRMILTGQAGLDTAIRAINGGEVYRYFTKPCNGDELAAAIRQGLQHKKLAEKSRKLLQEYQKQSSVLDQLEENDPGITQLEIDEDGAIFVETMAIELDELLKEFE